VDWRQAVRAHGHLLQDPLVEPEAEARLFQRTEQAILTWQYTGELFVRTLLGYQQQRLDTGPQSSEWDPNCANVAPEIGPGKVGYVHFDGKNGSSTGFILSADRFTLTPIQRRDITVPAPHLEHQAGCAVGPASAGRAPLAALGLLGLTLLLLRRRRT
jgi:MYXO-CTERM domain-containing protein